MGDKDDNQPGGHVWRPFKIGQYRKERGFSKSLKRYCREKRYWARKRQNKDVSERPGQHRSRSPGRKIVNEVSQFVEGQLQRVDLFNEDIDVDISADCVDPNPEQEESGVRASVCGPSLENGQRPTITLRVRRAMTRSEQLAHEERVKCWKEKNIYPFTNKGMYIVDTLLTKINDFMLKLSEEYLRYKAAMDEACGDSSDEPNSDRDDEPGPPMQQQSDDVSSDIDNVSVLGSPQASEEEIHHQEEVRCELVLA